MKTNTLIEHKQRFAKHGDDSSVIGIGVAITAGFHPIDPDWPWA